MNDYPDQVQMFAYEIVPILFHNQNSDFLSYLEKDQQKFLEFWWERAGLELKPEDRSSMEGLEYEIHPYKDGRKILLMRMPTPKRTRDPYFMGMVTRPPKRSFIPWKNNARIFALSLLKYKDGTQTTELAEVTRTARYVAIKTGPEARKNVFLDVITGILDQRK